MLFKPGRAILLHWTTSQNRKENNIPLYFARSRCKEISEHPQPFLTFSHWQHLCFRQFKFKNTNFCHSLSPPGEAVSLPSFPVTPTHLTWCSFWSCTIKLYLLVLCRPPREKMAGVLSFRAQPVWQQPRRHAEPLCWHFDLMRLRCSQLVWATQLGICLEMKAANNINIHGCQQCDRISLLLSGFMAHGSIL